VRGSGDLAGWTAASPTLTATNTQTVWATNRAAQRMFFQVIETP
jgi:hypothetical protein